MLGDDWVLMRGYCNRRGEIDHLLLGPPGLVAIESKHLNATVHCEGDSWRFEKFDKYGNLVARGSLSDRGGRSPSVQLNEPADLLEQFLRTRGAAVSILRVVLLTHPSSRRGRCRHPSVHVATSALALAGQLNDMPPVFGAAHRARIEELIARDHRYHEARRPPRRRPRRAQLEQVARRDRHRGDRDALGVLDRRGEHRRARDHAGLAGALDAERVERRRRLQVVDLDAVAAPR